MNTANENEDRYSVVTEATHILEGLHFAEEHPEPSIVAIKRRLRLHFVETWGMAWMRCTIISHTMPDGLMVFTASNKCKDCKTIHTCIAVVKADGSFDFAAPADE